MKHLQQTVYFRALQNQYLRIYSIEVTINNISLPSYGTIIVPLSFANRYYQKICRP